VLREGFLKLLSAFKEEAKTLSSIFSSTKKQKTVTTISACTESALFIIINLQKNLHLMSQFKEIVS
jgi:hypothetical protein